MKDAIYRWWVWMIACLAALALNVVPAAPPPGLRDADKSPTLPAGAALAPPKASTSSSIIMATDKTNYFQTEVIKLRVTNSHNAPTWYIDYPQRDLVFWEIERASSNGWRRVDFRLPIIEQGKEVCRIRLYEPPIGAVTELKSYSSLTYEWNQKICPNRPENKALEPGLIERGRYRFSLHYSLHTVKSADINAEPWKRPVELGETKVIYSNEFTLQ